MIQYSQYFLKKSVIFSAVLNIVYSATHVSMYVHDQCHRGEKSSNFHMLRGRNFESSHDGVWFALDFTSNYQNAFFFKLSQDF